MEKTERIQIIDFLRGISCIGILLYHVRVDLWVGWWEIRNNPEVYSTITKATAWLSIPTPFLGYAILLFFLISGFCIHYPNTKPESQPSWKIYFIRRLFRIYPSYAIAVVLTSIIGYFSYRIWGDESWNINRIIALITLSQNYPPEIGQLLNNPSLWTIPLEFEFYILYPIVFYFILKEKFRIITIFAFFCTILSVYLFQSGIIWLSFTAIFFWPCWLLGAWLAQLYRDNNVKNFKFSHQLIALSVAMFFALLASYKSWQWWVQYSTWTFFYFVFFIFCITQEVFLKRLLGVQTFRIISWIGTISFSLYLIHFPIFRLMGHIHHEIFSEKPANFLITLLYIVPVIYFSWIFYKKIEMPIHQWSKKFVGRA